jgi:predicted ATP-grasp superfamily ATP-dependent carboligase
MLIEEKNITEQIFRSLNIKQPDTIFKLTNNDIYGADLEKKGFEQIKIELLQNEYKKIFVKPVDGQGGYGIYIFHRDGKGNYVTKDNIELNNKFLNKNR